MLLLTPEEFHGAHPPKLIGYLTLPSAWDGFELDSKKLGGTGYATLGLQIIPGPQIPDLVFILFVRPYKESK
jgi:hypothetical protein